MQEDWAEPDWRVYGKCFACDEPFVLNNYEDRKSRPERHTFQGELICPWCWVRGGRKLAQAKFLMKALLEGHYPDHKIKVKMGLVMGQWGRQR